MCGLYGFLGRSDEKTKRILHLLSYFNEARGRDSSGLMLFQDVDRQLEPKYGGFLFKDVLVGGELYHAYGIKKYVREGLKTVAIGHTRAGTRGAKTKPNAHPYQEGKYIFAHNGMLSNFDHLQKIYGTEYEVDSQIIGYLLNNYDSKHKIFGKKLSGSYVVPFISMDKPYDLNIMVNTNPMSIAFSKDGSQMYFASLGTYLEDALLLEDVIDDFEIRKLDDECLYKYFIQADAIFEEKEKVKMKHKGYSSSWKGDASHGYNPRGSFYGKKPGDNTTAKNFSSTYSGKSDTASHVGSPHHSYADYPDGYGRHWDEDGYLSGYDLEKHEKEGSEYYTAKEKQPTIHSEPLANPLIKDPHNEKSLPLQG